MLAPPSQRVDSGEMNFPMVRGPCGLFAYEPEWCPQGMLRKCGENDVACSRRVQKLAKLALVLFFGGTSAIF